MEFRRARLVREGERLTIHVHPSKHRLAVDYANDQLPDIESDIIDDDTVGLTAMYIIDPRFANVRSVAT